MHEAFINAGISSEYITSKTPKLERERILKAFTDGAFMVLNNCGILTTGYDEPSIECVIMNRATKSLPLWLQCVGRGSRLYQNKNEFVLLDFGGNHTRLGMWNEPRTWSLKEKKKRKSNEVTPVKSCPKCDGIVFASARVCRYCGHQFPIDEKELAQGVMVEVLPNHLKGRRISELDLYELIELQQTKKYKPSYIWRVIRAKDLISEYAELMKYSKGWVWRQTEEQKNDNNNFTDYKI
jgi:superfamily II DNA or RNA helicase